MSILMSTLETTTLQVVMKSFHEKECMVTYKPQKLYIRREKGQIMDRPVHYIISNVIGNVISKLVPTMYIILDEIR